MAESDRKLDRPEAMGRTRTAGAAAITETNEGNGPGGRASRGSRNHTLPSRPSRRSLLDCV